MVMLPIEAKRIEIPTHHYQNQNLVERNRAMLSRQSDEESQNSYRYINEQGELIDMQPKIQVRVVDTNNTTPRQANNRSLINRST